MNGNCHFIFGAAVCATAITKFDMPADTATAFIATGLIGSIFPDIDNPSSHFGQLTKPLSLGIGKLQELAGKAGCNHRWILHDPIWYLVGLILSVTYCPYLYGFFVGCLSHLFLDSLNPAGILIFGNKRLHLLNVKSGSKTSIVLTWIFVAMLFIINLRMKGVI